MQLQNVDIDDQSRQEVVSLLRDLADKLSDKFEADSVVVLSAIPYLTDECVDVHRKLADYYYRNANWIKAVAHFGKCCALDQSDYIAMFYLANCYKNMGHHSEAIEVYLRSIAFHEYPEGLMNLSAAYSDLGERELELNVLNRLTSSYPQYTLGHYNLGIYWYGKKDLKESINCYKRALESNSDHGPSKVALALALLMDKQYVEGFKQYESRWGVIPNCPIREFNRPCWYGQDVPEGSSLLITVEQGFGDTLQMLRYLPYVLPKFSKIYVEVQSPMQRLVSLSYPQVDVVVNGDKLPQTDFYCPIMSLPRAFATNYQTIPAQGKYIEIRDPVPFSAQLDCDPRKKIGVCWRGGMHDLRMAHRSLTFKSIKDLFDAHDYVWVSLVKDLPDDERAELSVTKVVDLTAALTDFYDTYRLISGLDVIITVDTAVAHLAGAMGKPTIVILNEGYDWRWHVDDDISAWYPGTRLLRAYKLDGPNALVPELLAQVKKILD